MANFSRTPPIGAIWQRPQGHLSYRQRSEAGQPHRQRELRQMVEAGL